MKLLSEHNFNFVGIRWKCITASWVLIAIGLISIIGHGGLNYAIDFQGGTKIMFRFAQKVTTAEEDAVRNCLATMGLPGSVQNYEENGILIQTKGSEYTNKVFDALVQARQATGGRFSDETQIRAALEPFSSLGVAEILLRDFSVVSDTAANARLNINDVSDANLKIMIEKALGEELAAQVQLAIAAQLGVTIDAQAAAGKTDINTLNDSEAFAAALRDGAAAVVADALMAKQGQLKVPAEVDAVLQPFGLVAEPLLAAALLREPSIDDTIRFNLNTMTRPELLRLLNGIISQGKPANDLAAAATACAALKASRSGLLPDVQPLLALDLPPLARAVIQQRWHALPFSIESVEMVGPRIGAELKAKAGYAIIYSLIAMLIYIAIRFQFKYGVGAVVALAHDVLITVGFLSVLNREFDMTVIAALMTLVGFSMNDTVVVYDRIRENLRTTGSRDWAGVINSSINQTLSRTIITSLTVLITTSALLILGSAVTFDFALVMTFGVFIGTYSSIFVAAPILIEWHNYFEVKQPVR